MSERSLYVSLEEFGLSEYEVRAYLSLLKRDMASASDIAYYADIPRSKVYPTLQKLEKKGLVALSKSKPITGTAVHPESAFDDLIQDQISKVNKMNSIVSQLKQFSESNAAPRGSEAKRYIGVSADAVLPRLESIVLGARSSMRIMADRSGLGLLLECRESLLKKIRSGVRVTMLLPFDLVGSDMFRSIPRGIDVRVSHTIQNCIIFDDAEIFMVDSDTGEGAIFPFEGVLGAGQNRIFSQLWDGGMNADALLDLQRKDAQDIVKMICLIKDDGLNHAFSSKTAEHSRNGLLGLVAKTGIDLKSKALGEMIDIVDSTLRLTCDGSADYDEKCSTVTAESGAAGGGAVWLEMLKEYLIDKEYGIRTVRQTLSGGVRVHFKLSPKDSA